MDALWLVNILSNIIIAGLGWALRTLYGDIKSLRASIQETREYYVRREDLRHMQDELTGRLNRIEHLILNNKLKD